MGDIGDDFLSKNIDAGQCLSKKPDRFRQLAELILAVHIGAGGKIVFCKPVHGVFDRKDRLCEISGAYGGENRRGDGQDHGENDQLHPVESKSCIGTDRIFNQKISVLTGVGDRDPNMDTDHMVIAFYYVLIDLARLNIGKLVGISDKFPDAVFRLILNTGKEMAIAVNTGQIPCIVHKKDRSVDHPAQKRQKTIVFRQVPVCQVAHNRLQLF